MLKAKEPATAMADEPGALNAATLLRSTAIFRELSNDQLAEIWSRAKIHELRRGDVLVRQNAPSDSVYVVVSGRFEVWVEGKDAAINEIGVGEPIGEVGFFSGVPRTATIVAARDSVVLELDRASFDGVAREVPAIYPTLLRAMGRRLADVNARGASERRGVAARTIAVIAGGSEPIPQLFYDRLDNVVGRRGKGRLLNRDYLQRHFPGQSPDDPTVSNWLNAIEHEYELIAFLADDTLTDWTRKAIRQADQVLIVVSGAAPEGVNPVEAFAFATHPPARRRLVRLHERRTGAVEGTAAWLARTRRGHASPPVARGRSRLQEPASLPDGARSRLRRRRRRRIRPRPCRRVQGLCRARRELRHARRHQRGRRGARRISPSGSAPRRSTSAPTTCS